MYRLVIEELLEVLRDALVHVAGEGDATTAEVCGGR
jgi:hypothetical protein